MESVSRRFRILTLLIGCGFITVWTIIRSITNGVNFDVVGQIGVAQQWSQGFHEGAQFGATNYIFKLPLYSLINIFDFLSAHAALLVLALICNVMAYVAIVIIIEKILALYEVTASKWFYIAAIGLAAISERIFWLDYANSRNLETAGGLFVLYLGLRLWCQPNLRHCLFFITGGGLVFFADQLQLYVIGGGLLLFPALQLLRQRTRLVARQAAWLVGSVTLAAVIARGILWLVSQLLPVSFLVAPAARQPLTFDWLLQSLLGVVSSLFYVLDVNFWSAGSAINGLRQALNAALLLTLVITCIRYAKQIPTRLRQLVTVVTCCILASLAIYIASGQAAQPQTQRYLIMLPLLLLVLCASFISNYHKLFRRRITLPVYGAVAVSAVLVLGALIMSWPTRYSKDTVIDQTIAYLQQHNYNYALGSRDGIVVSYFSDGQTIVAPLICQPNKTLLRSNLFFDTAGFERPPLTTNVPLLVPAGGIVSSGSVCDQAAIVAQLGQPLRIEPVADGLQAFIYNNINI